MKLGKVYLLGAGIGGKDYLTIQAAKILSRASVLIYDALVDGELLELVADDCLRIDVGKRGGLPSTDQETINELLVRYCREGKRVVRLKSGDPGVFGRIYPEILSLQEANCDYELIPGISSALAAPLLTGIPLTEKDISRGFTVISGHEPQSMDWESLTKMDTLVILMGGRSLRSIIDRLRMYGRDGEESIAIIRHCGRLEQQVWKGTLKDIVEKTAQISLSPCVIIIGQVVSLCPPNSP
ncbi:MAG: Uroporphyrinogen-III C-methyltransferase [Chroococcopsis gigantea SAG 12.99]|jgi:uroporphyrinogen III methyltransferase/synthase|nr:Uroporphyrinogen-III C-methyltransferase [Chroococcopsis gigantea SAG 12.99]